MDKVVQHGEGSDIKHIACLSAAWLVGWTVNVPLPMTVALLPSVHSHVTVHIMMLQFGTTDALSRG